MKDEKEIPEGYYWDNSEELTPLGIIKHNELKKISDEELEVLEIGKEDG